MPVAEPDQFQQPSHNRTLKRRSDFAGCVVVPVDVAAHSRPRQKLHIVDSREQTGVVDLRNAGGEELDRTRQQILVVATAERVVEGAIDLVRIEVAAGGPGSFSALPGAAPVNGRDQRVEGPRPPAPWTTVRR